MNKKGLLVSCDRCNNKVFLNYKGKKETDGGFTKWDEYDDMPEGWKIVESHDKLGCSDICPECNKEYTLLMESFWNSRSDSRDD